jgi:hypothetical protein
LQKEPAALRTYLVAVTEPLGELQGDALAAAGLEREDKACAKAFGEGVEALDAAWRKYVKRRYPKN